MAAGRFVEAIPLYQELCRALPSNTGLRLNLGLAYHMTGRQAEAVREFERVLKSDPGNGLPLIALGVALLELNQPAKAVAPLEKVIAAQPSHAEARACSRMRFYRLVAHCLAHGRRQIVEVAQNFPIECRHVLEKLGEVYRNDAQTRDANLTAEERLRFHQQHSKPILDALHDWLEAQFAERKVEPNSSLGKALAYLLRHWKSLTLFLRQAGSPLDNNLCERALKRAVLHRKNALFYRTLNGAQVGDLFMSLIHTCELCDTNSFNYLTELQRHAQERAATPASWMPWDCREALGRTGV